MTLAFSIPGRPQPGGSKRAFAFHKGNGKLGVRVTDSNKKVMSWRGDVVVLARQAMQAQRWEIQNGPLELEVQFVLRRPHGHTGAKGLSKKGRETPYPTSKPDATKLLRALEDALSDAGVWTDDARVVRQVVTKTWGAQECAHVAVRLMAP